MKMSKLVRYPQFFAGKISHGLGRGSRQLGTPTANLAADELPLENGIYYGYARIMKIDEMASGNAAGGEQSDSDTEGELPLRSAMGGSSAPRLSQRYFSTSHQNNQPNIPQLSTQISPLYGFVACLADNASQVVECQKLLEVHLLHRFDRDFYGAFLRTAIFGRLRGERSYTSINQLIDDIQCDKRKVREILALEASNIKKIEDLLL